MATDVSAGGPESADHGGVVVSTQRLVLRRLTLGDAAFMLALLAYMTSGIFLQLAFQRYLWLLVALANATIWILTREMRRVASA